MALINLYKRDAEHNATHEQITYDGLACDWIVGNVDVGCNFAVYLGDPCEENDISRSDEMATATDVTVVILPAGELLVPLLISLVVSAAITLLIPTPDIPGNVSRTQESPNNQLSDRRNRIRINQRIPDICGTVLSIPDVIQNEFSRYVSGSEERIGVYCVSRNQTLVENLKDGDDLIDSSSKAQGANVFYPHKSPNKGDTPSQTFGIPVSDPVYGVYTDKNAISQTLAAPEVVTRNITTGGGGLVGVDKLGGFGWLIDPSLDFVNDYPIGSKIEFFDTFIEEVTGVPYEYVDLSSYGKQLEVSGNAFGRLEFLIANNPEWLNIVDDYVDYPVLDKTLLENFFGMDFETVRVPLLKSPTQFDGDTYRITSTKVTKLLFNVYAPNGIYKQNQSSGNYENAQVAVDVFYYRLNDNFERVGSLQTATGSIIGNTYSDIGITIEIDIGAPYFIEWYIARNTFDDTEFKGTVVDTVKLKSAYGLYDLGAIDFGNITMIQTRRRGLPDSAGVSSPELNCTATEMIYKYLGDGVFDTVLTTNTQAMQTLISKSLDAKIGRLSIDTDIDADLFLQIQSEIETYYANEKAGRCCYTLDSTSMSAQDTIYLISNAVSVIVWREWRLLTGFFESPQSFPSMLFTNRSKQPGSETWRRVFDLEYDGVEFKYTDETSGQQEVLTYPEIADNPKSFEIPGIKGVELATWRMMREYNKLQLQREYVEVTVTPEGRFVRPSKMISIVKGTRVGSFDGEVRGQSLLTVELSQEVIFTAGDEHYIQFKNRDGSVNSVTCTESALGSRFVELDFAPAEPLYYGNSEKKTEFSFANEARAMSQLLLPQKIDSSDKYYTSLKCVNYDVGFYKDDPITPIGRAYSDGYDSGFS